MGFRKDLLELVHDLDRFVVVTVIEISGSAPREVGARMVVSASSMRGSIGGGDLEYQAIERARQLLSNASASVRKTEFIGLGVTLKQCCGGAVQLMYEVFCGAESRQLVNDLATEYVRRPRFLVSRLADQHPARVVSHRRDLPEIPDAVWDSARQLTCSGDSSSALIADESGLWFITHLDEYPTKLVLFGAGHVGKALVKALQDLPFQIDWVDQRADMFPPQVPNDVQIFAVEDPLEVVDKQPEGAFFVVMTHSHGLDYDLCLRILKQRSFGWLGLIGSETKKQRFEQRLQKDGVDSFTLQRLVCPIGLASIRGKRPAVIALSSAAQLMEVRNQVSRSVARESRLRAELRS